MPLSDFPVLFKVDLIFKDFSRKPSKSSTFQACAKPVTQTYSNHQAAPDDPCKWFQSAH